LAPALPALETEIQFEICIFVLDEKAISKNRPVATNFQFLKMLCSTGTSLLQYVCISEVILLGCACPKPCSWFAPDGANSNGVSCFT
jgi:hypothetical protein